MRKLAGRLLSESLFGCLENQDFLCELLEFEPLNGRVCLNQDLPQLIKSKLQKNPQFLATITFIDNQEPRKYWSFPEYKDINGPSQTERETLAEYLNFPDSNLYMIGVKYKHIETRRSESLQSSGKKEIKSNSSSIPNFVSRASVDDARKNRHSATKQNSLTGTPKPIATKPKIQPVTLQFKTTTDSTESYNKGTDSGSQRSYMRHTSNSEKRVRSRSRTLQIKSSLVNKNRIGQGDKLAKVAANYLDGGDRSQSPGPEPDLQRSPELGKIIKRLNKPEMLMLNHLQN